MSKRRNDKGYSLVEMIIVIAIIAVVAAMAIVSVSMIRSAKAKDAAATVDSELATLITKSKNVDCDRANSEYAARIYKDNGVFYYQRGYYYYDKIAKKGNYVWNDTKESKVSLTSYVDIRYAEDKSVPNDDPSEKKVEDMNDGKGIFIRFAKNGMCVDGSGDLRFCKRNGNVVANVYIRANGSHQLR